MTDSKKMSAILSNALVTVVQIETLCGDIELSFEDYYRFGGEEYSDYPLISVFPADDHAEEICELFKAYFSAIGERRVGRLDIDGEYTIFKYIANDNTIVEVWV